MTNKKGEKFTKRKCKWCNRRIRKQSQFHDYCNAQHYRLDHGVSPTEPQKDSRRIKYKLDPEYRNKIILREREHQKRKRELKAKAKEKEIKINSETMVENYPMKQFVEMDECFAYVAKQNDLITDALARFAKTAREKGYEFDWHGIYDVSMQQLHVSATDEFKDLFRKKENKCKRWGAVFSCVDGDFSGITIKLSKDIKNGISAADLKISAGALIGSFLIPGAAEAKALNEIITLERMKEENEKKVEKIKCARKSRKKPVRKRTAFTAQSSK